MVLAFHSSVRAACAATLAVALSLGAHPRGALASPFSGSVELDTGYNAIAASAGIDDAGNAIALWTGNDTAYRLHFASGAWSAPVALSRNVVPGVDPVLRVTGGGDATVVSYGSGKGIYSADKLLGAPFRNAVRIVAAPNLVNTVLNTPPVQFLANARGDLAVAYEDYYGGTYRLLVARRAASTSLWGAPHVILSSASAGHLAISRAAIGPSGDVVVTYETYTVKCSRSCHENNFVVHALRAAPASNAWRDSGPLTTPSFAYATMTSLDPQGRAVVFIQPAYTGLVIARTQAGAGAAWSGAATVFASSAAPEVALESVDGPLAGAATAALLGLATSGNSVNFVDGNLAANRWALPVNLAAHDASGAGSYLATGA